MSDIQGQPLQIPLNSPATVFYFILHDCPISNAYAPRINRIAADYTPRGVKQYVVYVDEGVMNGELEQHTRQYAHGCPTLRDPTRSTAHRLGVTVAPSAAVLDDQGQLVYLGRIDDLYPALGQRRLEPTTHDLRDALDAVLAGRAIAHPRTAAVGCSIANGVNP
jgi:AhpC/TSA family